MKLLIEVTLKKIDGKTCDPEEVAEVVMEALDGETLYPQNADADDESTYEITDTKVIPYVTKEKK